MIHTITLRNYRGHTETTIPCGRLTLLVGENASGKTSVLHALRWISEGIGPTLPAQLLRRGAAELEVVVEGEGAEGRFRIDAVYEPENGSPALRSTRSSTQPKDIYSPARRPQVVFLSLDAEALVAPSSAKSVKPALDPSGRGLAAVLAYLKLAETERFERIVERLRAVVPIVRGLGFTRVEASETVPRLVRVEDRVVELSDTVTSIQDALVFDFADADKVPASLVSEGTLLALGTLTAIETLDLAAHPFDAVLIDDVDCALHPRAQRALVATLRAILDTVPDLQILATSHSPYLVDAARPDEVVLLGRDAHGAIAAKRLDAFPDERLRTMLSTGELWMSEGEDWIAR
jgi:predicted ATPase